MLVASMASATFTQCLLFREMHDTLSMLMTFCPGLAFVLVHRLSLSTDIISDKYKYWYRKDWFYKKKLNFFFLTCCKSGYFCLWIFSHFGNLHYLLGRNCSAANCCILYCAHWSIVLIWCSVNIFACRYCYADVINMKFVKIFIPQKCPLFQYTCIYM